MVRVKGSRQRQGFPKRMIVSNAMGSSVCFLPCPFVFGSLFFLSLDNYTYPLLISDIQYTISRMRVMVMWAGIRVRMRLIDFILFLTIVYHGGGSGT